MKRLLLFFALAPAVLLSQNNNDKVAGEPIEQSIFSLGVKGAFGHSFVEPYENSVFNPSWNAGISAIYAPWMHWGIGMDVLYSGEGVKLKTDDYTATTTLDYLRIPLKAIYFFRMYENDFRPKVSLGPTFGFLVNDHGNNDFNTFDFGMNATIGFNYRLARAIWLNVDVNYYQGFTDIYDYNNETDRNGNIRLDLGLSFGF